MDVDDMADEDREKLEAGLLGFALVQVIHEDTPQETHAWGEVNVRESDSKHVDNILDSFKVVGRQDWDHPMTVTVDEEMVDMSTIVPSPVPYSAVPVLKFKAKALSRILHYLRDTCRTVHPTGCPKGAQAISWEEVSAPPGAHDVSCSAFQGLQNAGSLM